VRVAQKIDDLPKLKERLPAGPDKRKLTPPRLTPDRDGLKPQVGRQLFGGEQAVGWPEEPAARWG
jgi:hypothetical protein